MGAEPKDGEDAGGFLGPAREPSRLAALCAPLARGEAVLRMKGLDLIFSSAPAGRAPATWNELESLSRDEVKHAVEALHRDRIPFGVWTTRSTGPRPVLDRSRSRFRAAVLVEDAILFPGGLVHPMTGQMRLGHPDGRIRHIMFGNRTGAGALLPARFARTSQGPALEADLAEAWEMPDAWGMDQDFLYPLDAPMLDARRPGDEAWLEHVNLLDFFLCPHPRTGGGRLLDLRIPALGRDRMSVPAWNLLAALPPEAKARRLQAFRARPWLFHLLAAERGSERAGDILRRLDAGAPFLDALCLRFEVPRSFASMTDGSVPWGRANPLGDTLAERVSRFFATHRNSHGEAWTAQARAAFAAFWSALAALPPARRLDLAFPAAGMVAGEEAPLFGRLLEVLPKGLSRGEDVPSRAVFRHAEEAARAASVALGAALGSELPTDLQSPFFLQPLWTGRSRVSFAGLSVMERGWHAAACQGFIRARTVQLLDGVGAALPPGGRAAVSGPLGEARWLLTARDLAGEGEDMDHCVASYFAHVASGRCAIASLRGPDGERGTAEYVPSRDGTWRMSQLSGPSNAQASPGMEALARSLLPILDRPGEAFLSWTRRMAEEPEWDKGAPVLFSPAREGDGPAAMDFLRRFVLHPRVRGWDAGRLAAWLGLPAKAGQA